MKNYAERGGCHPSTLFFCSLIFECYCNVQVMNLHKAKRPGLKVKKDSLLRKFNI